MEGSANHGKEHEKKLRGRLMNKLFKEKKPTLGDDGVDEFLHGPSDKLHMMPVTTSPSFPPLLQRIDTSTARRWPSPRDLQRAKDPSNSPKRNRKGLTVRFTDRQPEVIGEGGDEATEPVSDIGLRKRSNTHPPLNPPSRDQNPTVRRDTEPGTYGRNVSGDTGVIEPFRPGLIRRTQTGFESIPDLQDKIGQNDFSRPRDIAGKESLLDGRQTVEAKRRSFAEMAKDEMRGGEGLALVHAAGKTSSIDEQFARADSPTPSDFGITNQLNEVHLNTMKNTQISSSPGIPTQQDSVRPVTPPREHQISNNLTESPSTLSRTSSMNPHETVMDDALQDFSRRVAHLFTLFRLSTESTRPLPKCSLEELVRAALWWFLKGRLNLEATIRDRPANSQAQQTNFYLRQQSYADLAKSLWIAITVTSKYPETQLRPGSVDSNSSLADVLDSRQGIISGLQKLTLSMKRNNFLPPDADDAPLPQGLDASIWVKDEGNRTLLASQRPHSPIPLSESFILGDTARTFQLARMFTDGVLLEDAASQHYYCPVLISIIRGQNEREISAIIANQDGLLNLIIQTDKSRGPTWEDVRWQFKHNAIEINLPRGFRLRLNLSEQDLRTLWGIYDYENRTHSSLVQRHGEELIFERVVPTFQLFEPSSQPSFPKEPQPHCRLRIFEKTIVEKAATGPRTLHRGFRIGLNTGTRTKNLRGVDQDLPPNLPIQFGFLRGEGGLPALLLKINDAKMQYTMVFTFDDMNDRTRLHALLTGTCLKDAEDIVAEAPIQKFSVATGNEKASSCLPTLEWQNFRFINENFGNLQSCKTVLSEHLRLAIDFKTGSLTDRINVGPGELKIRLTVNSQNELKILRQPQQDMTFSVSESQVPKEFPQEVAVLLDVIATSESTRTYTFPSTKELHLFQAALTGFEVLFDGKASSFNIARRRMVVPIYKKWDAAMTRLQVVQKEKIVQLIAFFENFSHGDCMNFSLKSTDVFETSSRSGKFSLRIVDAKFAMPKSKVEGESGTDREFVCLDMPEYPGEHDDITIVFDSETDMEAFTKALPAPVKVASRIGSVRR